MKSKKRVTKYLKKWTYLLGLRWWQIYVCWSDDHDSFNRDGSTVVARTFSDWRYMTATVTFYLPAIKDKTDEELEMYVIHELCHVLVNEMREQGIDHEERVVTTLQKAFFWTRNVEEE